MRTSAGCMRSILSPFLSSRGEPSKAPTRHSSAGPAAAVVSPAAAAAFLVALPPAATATVSCATKYSPRYSLAVYVPGFIGGDVYDPSAALATAQYCASLLCQCSTASKPAGTPLTLPETCPRPASGTYPVTERLPKKLVSTSAEGCAPVLRG